FDDCTIFVSSNIELCDYNHPSVSITLTSKKTARKVTGKMYYTGRLTVQGFRKLTDQEKEEKNFPWDNDFRTAFKGDLDIRNEKVFNILIKDLKGYLSSEENTPLIEEIQANCS